jgi:PAS domain S-box-containing protein
MTKLFEAIENSADGAFIINEDLEIVYWNRAAEEIVGFDQSEVIGQLCFKILQGYDEHHRLICRLHCQVAQASIRGELVSNYDLHIRTKSGDKRWMNVSIFTYSDDDDDGHTFIVHLFRDINQRVLEVARYYHSLPQESDSEKASTLALEVLTPREREVLALLVKGHGTQHIAQLLSISPSTVRNHIQHVLQKLQVHNRLEAVTLAIKFGLVD